MENNNVDLEYDKSESEYETESESESESESEESDFEYDVKKQNNAKIYYDDDDEYETENQVKIGTNTNHDNQTKNDDIELESVKWASSTPVLHSIQNIYVHVKKQVTTTSEKFDSFISFLTEFTPYTDRATVLKYTFYLGCTIYFELGEFMLKNSKCNDQMLTDILPHCSKSSLHEICGSIKNYTLFECFINNISNHMALLLMSYPSAKPALFSVDTFDKIKCLCNSKDFNKSILKDVIYNGQNYFQTLSQGYCYHACNHLLSLDMCTSDIILYNHEHEPLEYVMRLFKDTNSKFSSIIESGKLPDYIFDQIYKEKPSYMTFMDFSGNGNNISFIQSPHCTVERATAFLNHKYKDWDVYNGFAKKPKDLMKYIFDCDKFKCLKDKFYDTTVR